MSSQPGERHRVLILIKGLGIGGAENLLIGASPFWDKERFDYRVAYLLPWKDQLVAPLQDRGVDVTCLNWNGPSSFGGVNRTRSLLGSFRPEIIHSHLPVAGLFARLLGSGSRQVYTEHNVVDFYRQPTRSLNRITYRRNDAVIAVSQAVAESIAGYPGPAPHVIPNGVLVPQFDESTRATVRSELGIDEATPLVVHIGNIRPHKGHETLIKAIRPLVNERPDVRVVSIGGEKHDGDLERIRGRAAELRADTHLTFLGRRSDALRFVAAADLAVNPSDVEGLPVFILEALALGVPVVATDVGGVSSVVKHRITGLLVKPGDPDRLANALAEALESPQRGQWGKEGAALVAREHSLESMVRRYEDVYESLLS